MLQTGAAFAIFSVKGGPWIRCSLKSRRYRGIQIAKLAVMSLIRMGIAVALHKLLTE